MLRILQQHPISHSFLGHSLPGGYTECLNAAPLAMLPAA